MSVIVENLPFHPYETRVHLPGRSEEVVVLPRQIIVWLSLTKPDVLTATASLRFPAVLDTGLNESFVISRGQLIDWASVREDDLPLADDRRIRVYEDAVFPRDANLWMYQNLPFTNAEVSDAPPLLIEIDAGILISGDLKKPRLPLIGMRAIESAGLYVTVDGSRQSVSIQRLAS